MATRLLPCPECDRHVRATEPRCPFCDAPLPAAEAAPARRPAAALTRAAILFAGATAVTACGPGSSTADAASDTAVGPDLAVLYGPAPTDVAPAEAASDVVNSPDIVAMYGPAPVDAGPEATVDAAPGRDGDPVVLYGPAPVDGSSQG